MASIGGLSVITLRGGINPGTGEQLQDITRPGVDGIAYRKVGKRGRPFTMESVVDVANAAAVTTAIANYKALQGTLVTVVENNGQTWTNVAVLNVRPAEPQKVLTATTGSDYLLRATWTLQMTETS